MTAAFAAGQLSYSKVRAMTRVATPKSETDLVAVARHGTASHIDRIVAGYRQVERNMDPDRARAQLRRRGVWYETEDDGTVTITIRGGPDAVDLIKQAITAAMPEVPKPIDQPDAPHAARRFDAFEHITRVYLEPDEHAAPRTETVIHADLETLTEARTRPGRARRRHRHHRHRAAAPDLRQRAPPRPPTHRGRTLDIGRRSRTIPPALRRAILDRDQGTCRFPGCTHRRATPDPPRPALGSRREDQAGEPDPRLPLPPQGPARRRLARHRRRQRRPHLHRPPRSPHARSLTPTTPHRRHRHPQRARTRRHPHCARHHHVPMGRRTPRPPPRRRLALVPRPTHVQLTGAPGSPARPRRGSTAG